MIAANLAAIMEVCANVKASDNAPPPQLKVYYSVKSLEVLSELHLILLFELGHVI